ncbi:MAG: hypothetical protein ACUVTD_08310 [Nitrososphaerales archaeon]
MLISLIFNALVQALIFIIPYIESGLLGLYAGYRFYIGKVGKYLRIISALAISYWSGIYIHSILYRVRNKRSNWPCFGNILDKCMDAMEGDGKAVII